MVTTRDVHERVQREGRVVVDPGMLEPIEGWAVPRNTVLVANGQIGLTVYLTHALLDDVPAVIVEQAGDVLEVRYADVVDTAEDAIRLSLRRGTGKAYGTTLGARPVTLVVGPKPVEEPKPACGLPGTRERVREAARSMGDCSCGHPVQDHQSGDGPYTGFCGGADCDCESPFDECDNCGEYVPRGADYCAACELDR